MKNLNAPLGLSDNVLGAGLMIANKFMTWLIVAFVLIVFVDPSGKMTGLKYVFFSAVLICAVVYVILSKKINKIVILVSCAVFCFVLVPTIIGVGCGQNLDFTLSMLKASFFFLYCFSLYCFYEKFKYAIIICSVLLCFFVLYLFALNLGFFPDENGLISYLNGDVKNAKITWRWFMGYHVPMVYYNSIILLVLPVSILSSKYRNKKESVIMFLFIFVLAISGTRTNLVIAIIMLLFILFNESKNKFRMSFLAVTFSPCIVFSFIYIIFFSDVSSNLVKTVNFFAYLDILSVDYLFLGEGFGSTFYSPIHGKHVMLTELVYLDIFRWFGLSFGLLFLFFLFLPNILFLMSGKYNLLGCYLAYFIVMGSNPLLFSSTGMFIVAFFFVECVKLRLFVVRKNKSGESSLPPPDSCASKGRMTLIMNAT